MGSPQDPGFAQAKSALDQAAGQTKWINEQVSGGHLRMNPETAEAAAKHCEDYARRVGRLRTQAGHLSLVNGLGDYQVSLALKHHFEQKATQAESGALPLLKQLQAEMLNQADAFRAAAKDYRATDDQIAQDMNRKGKQ